MKQRERCGQMSAGYVCDRDRDHDGNHRGYNEHVDEPFFWLNREQAVLDFLHWARLYTPAAPDATVRAMAHAIGHSISVKDAQDALLAVHAERGGVTPQDQGPLPSPAHQETDQ